MKRKVKVGLVQMRCSADAAGNLKRAIAHMRDCASRGAQIICLPELFLNEYFCQGKKSDKYFDFAETIPGETTGALAKVARETGTIIICPLFEKNPGKKKGFNSAAIIGSDGEIIGTYHKMHIPSLPQGLYAEDYYFEKGDKGFMVFDTPFGKIAPLICYDQWFPEGARAAAAKGAEILFYPTAIGWPCERTARAALAGAVGGDNAAYARMSGSRGFPRSELLNKQRAELGRAEHEAWQIIQRGHSIANNVFVCAVNRVGVEGNLKFWGTSFVSDPYGRVLAKAGSEKEENLVVELDLSVITEMRKEWPFLEERRVI